MRSFYHFALTYRGKNVPDDESRLADWIFQDQNFPKHTVSYDELSNYLELYSPFPNALLIFDELWTAYQLTELKDR